ncbi:MAG TPA: CHASE3 domain-containing protein [Mycobacteriales bacterium]|nr:CHASE3 domain-containing protein [Mycobacteriales bacterium]
MRGGLTERTVVAGGLLALVIGAAFAILLSSVADLRADQRRSLQSEGVLVAANRLERLVIDLETAQRGFLLTGQEEFLEPWTSARTEYPDQAATLQQLLTDGDPDQRARAGRIVRAADSYLQDYSIPTVEAARRDRAAVQVDPVSLQGKRRIDGIRAEFDRFTGAEQDLATAREERTDVATRRAITAAAVGLAVSVGLIVLYTGYLTTAMVRPLRLAAALAGRLAGGDLSARLPERGVGEIGVLERSLNTMAGSLQRGRADLASSRARVVTAGDRARRRIERDLHDGTQQRLISLLLELRSAEAAVPADQPELRAQLDRIAAELTAALEDLRELAQGIHPAILSEGGLGPAVKALARRSAVPVELDLDLPARLPEPVEVAAYYVVSEALANAAKHARAEVVEVAAAAEGDTLRLSVHDDGVGGATPGAGSGLLGLTDRVESLGGTISVDSPPGEGTTVRVVLPTGAR